jgi:hypothetical protein
MAVTHDKLTPYGDRYLVDVETGLIRRPGEATSGGWKMIGLVRTGPGFAFGTGLIPLADVSQCLKTGLKLQYKNGRPRFTVRDWDHGTVRTWGNTRYHGVYSIVIKGTD